jgi:hypothetical protein
MNMKILKSKITRLLKANNFVKSEIKKEWNHPKHKTAGFEYPEMFSNYKEAQLTYYIPESLFTEEEISKRRIEKVQQMYDVLIKDENIKEHLTKWDYSITLMV